MVGTCRDLFWWIWTCNQLNKRVTRESCLCTVVIGYSVRSKWKKAHRGKIIPPQALTIKQNWKQKKLNDSNNWSVSILLRRCVMLACLNSTFSHLFTHSFSFVGDRCIVASQIQAEVLNSVNRLEQAYKLRFNTFGDFVHNIQNNKLKRWSLNYNYKLDIQSS